MLKEIWNDIHMRYSAGQVIAVDDFCSIHKATSFSAEQMIFGVEASRFIESLRLKDKLFPFLTSSNSMPELNLPFLLRHLDLHIKCISVSLANNMVVDRYYGFVGR